MFKKIVSLLLILTLCNYNIAFSASASSEAKSLFNSSSPGLPSYTNGTIDYSFTNDDGNTISGSINKDDLWNQELYPNQDLSSLTNNAENLNALEQQGDTERGVISQESKKENSSIAGSAYFSAVTTADASKPDLSNDPMLDATRNALSDSELELFNDAYQSCEDFSSLVDKEKTVHMPDYKNCLRIKDEGGSCDLKHIVTVEDPIEIGKNATYANIQSCGAGCMDIWLGSRNLSGSCQIKELNTSYMINVPEAITKATLSYVEVDDYLQVFIGNSKVYSSHGSSFPPETVIYEGQYYSRETSPSMIFVAKYTSGKNDNEHKRNLNWAQWVANPRDYDNLRSSAKCELKKSNVWTPNIDVTSHFTKASLKGKELNFKTRTSVSGTGEGFAKIRILYDVKKAIKTSSWSPQSCVDYLNEVKQAEADGMASTSLTCKSKFPAYNGNSNCSVFGSSVVLCESDFSKFPLPASGLTNMCQTSTVSSDYSYYKGTGSCYVSASGETVCPSSTDVSDTSQSSCKEFEDAGCGFISSNCVEGSETDSGECYVHNEKWDCGYDELVTTQTWETGLMCDGEVQCLGGNCVDNEEVDSTQDLAEAMAILNAMQFMGQDMNCTTTKTSTGEKCETDSVKTGQSCTTKSVKTGQHCEEKIVLVDCEICIHPVPVLKMVCTDVYEDETTCTDVYEDQTVCTETFEENQACEAFSGEIGNCQFPAASAFQKFSCCKSGDGNQSYKDYLRTIFLHPVYDAAVMGVGLINPDLSNQFASLEQNVTGELADIIGEDAAYVAAEALKAYASDYLYGALFQAAATGAASGAAATGAANTMGTGAASSAMSMFATAYTAYMVTMAVLAKVYECKDSDFETTGKRDLKLCSYIGTYCSKKIDIGLAKFCVTMKESYCCYNSPLSRIIQETARPQLGLSNGSAKNPICGGIPIDRIKDVDWSAINWDEWIAILQASGYMDDSDFSVESITGQGSTFDYDGSRENVGDRNSERLEDLEIDTYRIDEQQNYDLDYD